MRCGGNVERRIEVDQRTRIQGRESRVAPCESPSAGATVQPDTSEFSRFHSTLDVQSSMLDVLFAAQYISRPRQARHPQESAKLQTLNPTAEIAPGRRARLHHHSVAAVPSAVSNA